jgi:N-acetylglutamate synthase-like GNAT family acetyltransferase
MLRAHPEVVVLPAQQIEDGLVFVAERADAVLGFAALLRHEGGVIELDGLFVEAGVWRQGTGRALVEHCAAFARAEGAHEMEVIANLHAEGFYERLGFQAVRAVQTQFEAARLMRRPL